MRTLKTSRRELEHVAVCVTGEVSAEFIRDIQETMRRENQRRRDAGRPGMSYTVSGGEGSPEEWLRKVLNRDLENRATLTVHYIQGPVVRLALTGRQAAALRAAVEMELAHQRGQELRLSRLIGAGLAGVARCGGAAEQYISGVRQDIATAAELAELRGQGHPGRRRCRGMSRQLIVAVLGLALRWHLWCWWSITQGYEL